MSARIASDDHCRYLNSRRKLNPKAEVGRRKAEGA